MENIQIICDSIANMPDYLANEYNIDVVPYYINVDGIEYIDTVFSNEEFFSIIRNAKEIPKSSHPSQACFKAIFERYVNEGKKILYISGSSISSGAYQSAILASRDIDGDIHIFDSMCICFTCGMQVLSAARMVKEGKTITEILTELEKLRSNAFVTMSATSLDYLLKGGRISNGKSFICNALNVRPLLTIKDGLIYHEGNIRGVKRIPQKLIDRTKEVCGFDFSDKTITIGCGDNFKDRDKLEELVRKELKPKELILLTFNPLMCTHIGPEVLALTCYKN